MKFPSGNSIPGVVSSHPSRVCGLKLRSSNMKPQSRAVTPLAGVWIEISMARRSRCRNAVTPLAGVWIEI